MKKNLLILLIITIIFTTLDQLTKYIAAKYFLDPKIIIESLFSLDYHQNTGIAFSIGVHQLLIIVLTYIFLFIGMYIAEKELNLNKWISRICLALILGGAIGNLIDRSTHGYVVDFISVWKWPVFNIADTGIVLGILGIIAFYGKIKRVN